MSKLDPNLESILDAAREGVLVVDDSLRVVGSNRSANKIFSRDGGSLIGSRISEIFRDAALYEAFRTAAAEGKATDLRFESLGSTSFIFKVHTASASINGKRHAVGFFSDVTQVERLERVRQEFLSNISHELRTPLTSIMAFVETLEDGAIDDSDNNRRFLTVIRRNAERMKCLVSDIAELSMIESGQVSIVPGEVRVGHLVDEVFTNLGSRAAERNVELANLVAPDRRVFADLSRLEQMLTNLIDNAIKFNVEGGSVKVAVEAVGGFDVIRVTDTGEGIRPDQLNRIFERFYRIDRGRTREVGGTGLGLSIVKHLARLHGGEISASSRLGAGTVFEIRLPIAPLSMPNSDGSNNPSELPRSVL